MHTLSYLYEDSHLLVVNKPPGVVVVAGRQPETAPILRQMVAQDRRRRGLSDSVWVVHRLDRGTSGAVVLALDAATHSALSTAFESRGVHKTYLAWVLGTPAGISGRVALPIAPARRGRSRIDQHGKRAVTRWRLLAQRQDAALLEVEPETGRTHQVRVHLAAVGLPLLGDPAYRASARVLAGVPEDLPDPIAFSRPALHAWRLEFVHPVTGLMLEVEAPLPEDFPLDGATEAG